MAHLIKMGEWIILRTEEPYDLYSSSNIRVIKNEMDGACSM